MLEIWPVEGKQLQHWLRDRLAGRGLSIHDDALELLIERSEGNLLAAAQEVDKLALLAEGGTVDADTVQQAVGDSSRYTPSISPTPPVAATPAAPCAFCAPCAPRAWRRR